MQRISVHISEDLNKKIDFTARSNRKVKAQLIREALEAGLDRVIKPNPNKALFEFIKLAEGIPSKPGEPTDISTNHDYYAWGGEKKTKK